MGQLHDLCTKIDTYITTEKLDKFKVRGQLSLVCGFMLGFVSAKTPDDPGQIAALKKAGLVVLKRNF